jgi:hypothetical protein
VLFTSKVLTLPKDQLFSFMPLNSLRSFFENHGRIVFWTLFGILLSISVAINTIGAITDVHPTNTTYFDHNIELLLSGQISGFIWSFSPLLGFAIIFLAVIVISVTLYEIYRESLST